MDTKEKNHLTDITNASRKGQVVADFIINRSGND